MKQMLLVAALSATLGAAVAVLLSTPQPAPRPADAGRSLDIASLEAALAGALERAGWRAPPAVPDAAPAPIEVEDPVGSAAPVHRASGAESLPAPDVRTLESLADSLRVAGGHRLWLFTAESDVLRWLGAPDEVQANDGTERWVYAMPGGADGNHGLPQGGRRSLLVDFHRGRMIALFLHD